MNVLYKYLDENSGHLMLENNNLQFTSATKLNDPFDCCSELLDFTKYGSCSEQKEQKELFESSRPRYMVCSLSKTHESLLMWSYYNQHRGICLGLDMDKVLSCLKRDYSKMGDFFCPFDVTYSELFEKLDYLTNQEDSFRHIIRQKAVAWNHEQEVRMIVQAALIKGDKCFTGDYWRPKIDGECFTSIHFGVNIDDGYKAKILCAARSLNPQIQVFQMQTNPNAFKLDSVNQ